MLTNCIFQVFIVGRFKYKEVYKVVIITICEECVNFSAKNTPCSPLRMTKCFRLSGLVCQAEPCHPERSRRGKGEGGKAKQD